MHSISVASIIDSTPLISSIVKGHEDGMKLLLACGVDLKKCGKVTIDTQTICECS